MTAADDASPRQRLLAKAIELLEQVGEEKFSVRSVAKELEQSPTAPLQHFRTADELLLAMAQEGFRRLEEEIAPGLERTRTPRTRILAAGGAYVDFAAQRPRLYQLMFSPRFGSYEDAGRMHIRFDHLPSTAPYAVTAETLSFWRRNRPGEWSSRSLSSRERYAEAHRAFVAPVYDQFRRQMLELTDPRNLEDRTLAVTLLLHGLASEVAAGWIRRTPGETGRVLVERYLPPLLG